MLPLLFLLKPLLLGIGILVPCVASLQMTEWVSKHMTRFVTLSKGHCPEPENKTLA